MAQKIDSLDGKVTYKCQATQLPYATTNLDWWDIRQYIEDFTSGNTGIGRIFSGFIYMAVHNVSFAGIGLGRAIRWFYYKLFSIWEEPALPPWTGNISDRQATSMKTL